MKGIILAAGEGKRLKPFTDNNPKCFIQLEDKSILDRQIEAMRSCGVEDIIVIKGHLQEKISRKDVRYYVNPQYDKTNMVMTLWCAEKEFDGNCDIIVSYGDIIYNKEVLQKLIQSSHDISVVVDMDWESYWKARFSDPLNDAEAFKMDSSGKINIIGQKANEIGDIDAGYIGLIKFNVNGIDIFRNSFLNARKVYEDGGKAWGSPREFQKAYMTDMLQGLVNEGNALYAVGINGGWLEIDSSSDFELAKTLFENGKVKKIQG